MASPQSPTQEPVEAIIISGDRKGELVFIPPEETALSPAETALLNALVEDARRMAESARAATEEAEALLQELRQARGK